MGHLPKHRPAPESTPLRLIQLRPAQLRSHPNNIRRYYPQAGIEELAHSIKAHGGLIQPLVVMPAPNEPGIYLVIVGNRRYRAGVLLGDECPPLDAKVETDVAAVEQLLMMVSENLIREAPDPISEALHYLLLVRQEGMSISEIAHRTGVSHVRVSSRLWLIELDQEIQQLVAEGRLPCDPRTANALMSVADRDTRIKLARRFAEDGVNIKAIVATCQRVVEKLGARQDAPVRRLGRPAIAPTATATPATPMVANATAKLGARRRGSAPTAWPAVRTAAQVMCRECDVYTDQLRNSHAEPAWQVITHAASATCNACDLREFEKICAACPGVQLLKNIIKQQAQQVRAAEVAR